MVDPKKLSARKSAKVNAEFESAVAKDFEIGGTFNDNPEKKPKGQKKIARRSDKITKKKEGGYSDALLGMLSASADAAISGGNKGRNIYPNVQQMQKDVAGNPVQEAYVAGFQSGIDQFNALREKSGRGQDLMFSEANDMSMNAAMGGLPKQNAIVPYGENVRPGFTPGVVSNETPKITDDMSFSTAFSTARKNKMTTFPWRGKVYGTQLAGTSKELPLKEEREYNQGWGEVYNKNQNTSSVKTNDFQNFANTVLQNPNYIQYKPKT